VYVILEAQILKLYCVPRYSKFSLFLLKWKTEAIILNLTSLIGNYIRIANCRKGEVRKIHNMSFRHLCILL
jgi:hypothetical protein